MLRSTNIIRLYHAGFLLLSFRNFIGQAGTHQRLIRSLKNSSIQKILSRYKDYINLGAILVIILGYYFIEIDLIYLEQLNYLLHLFKDNY